MRKVGFILLALCIAPSVAVGEQLATVGKKTVDRAQVEKQVKAQLAELERQRYDVMKSGLDQLIGESLFEQEAAARGVTVEQFQQTEIVDKVKQPTEEEVQKVYEDNKEDLGDTPMRGPTVLREEGAVRGLLRERMTERELGM